ncbi:MAG: preprotein translocase subunit YajC [Bacteroidia bacterium]|nr:preprotein translocase subunit YajC [Bacteroidia bacterium]
MNTFFILQAGQQAAGSNWSFLLMMVAIFAVMYFFMIRPQQKKQKEIEQFRNSLKKGDKVVTIGGIYGTVVEIKEKYILVEVDSNVKLRIDKSAIVKDMSDVPAK